MADNERWARCNFDGKPIHPDDAEIIATFREWLALPEEERRAPEWHEFLGIKTTGETTEDGDGCGSGPGQARGARPEGRDPRRQDLRFTAGHLCHAQTPA